MSGILEGGLGTKPAGLSWGQWSSPQAWFGPQQQRGEAPCYSTVPAHLCLLFAHSRSHWCWKSDAARTEVSPPAPAFPSPPPACCLFCGIIPVASHGSSLLLSSPGWRTQSPIHPLAPGCCRGRPRSPITRNAFSFSLSCLGDLGSESEAMDLKFSGLNSS